MPDVGSAPATAPPPGASDPGQSALQSGGAGSSSPQGGVLPPSASAPPTGGGIHPAGVHAVGMEGMRKLMGALHFFRSMLDPMTEESKVADKMFAAGRKHFMPDNQAAAGGQVPPMNMGAGGPQGGAPPMAAQGGNQIPVPAQHNMPTGPAPMMRQAA